MPSGEDGFARVITEIIGGFVTSAILSAFVSAGVFEPAIVLLINLLNGLMTASMLLAMKYWGTTYLIGWLGGLFLMAQTGLVGPLDFGVYLIFPLLVLFARIFKD